MFNCMRLFQATAFYSKSPKEIQILKDYLYCINTDGMIEKIVAPEDLDYQPLLDMYQGTRNFHRRSICLNRNRYRSLSNIKCVFRQ